MLNKSIFLLSKRTIMQPALKEMPFLDLDALETKAAVLKAISHPTRLAIVQLLAQHEKLSVNQLCQKLDAEQSLISHHLSNMRKKNLLLTTKSGTKVYYSLIDDNLISLLGFLNKMDI